MESLIELLPDDAPLTFYTKLSFLSLKKIEEENEKFNQYKEYSYIINCYLALKKRPEFNVKLIYIKNKGWHLSYCDESLPNVPIEDKNICNCLYDIQHPDSIFHKLTREKYKRCVICHRPQVELLEP